MKFRALYNDSYLWNAGPARVSIWKTIDEKWKMRVLWGALESVGTFSTQEEAEEKAKEILNDHIRKLLEEIEK